MKEPARSTTPAKRPYTPPVITRLGTWQALTLTYSVPFNSFAPFRTPSNS